MSEKKSIYQAAKKGELPFDALHERDMLIEVRAGKDVDRVVAIADEFEVPYAGKAWRDSGEPITEDSVAANTALYFKNDAMSKSGQFMNKVLTEVPGALVGVTNAFGPEDDESELFHMNFDDLSEPEDELDFPEM